MGQGSMGVAWWFVGCFQSNFPPPIIYRSRCAFFFSLSDYFFCFGFVHALCGWAAALACWLICSPIPNESVAYNWTGENNKDSPKRIP